MGDKECGGGDDPHAAARRSGATRPQFAWPCSTLAARRIFVNSDREKTAAMAAAPAAATEAIKCSLRGATLATKDAEDKKNEV